MLDLKIQGLQRSRNIGKQPMSNLSTSRTTGMLDSLRVELEERVEINLPERREPEQPPKLNEDIIINYTTTKMADAKATAPKDTPATDAPAVSEKPAEPQAKDSEPAAKVEVKAAEAAKTEEVDKSNEVLASIVDQAAEHKTEEAAKASETVEKAEVKDSEPDAAKKEESAP